MLVLKRNISEVIRIGDNIQIMVVSCQDGSCRLGITAPVDVPVHRQEIYEIIQCEKGEHPK